MALRRRAVLKTAAGAAVLASPLALLFRRNSVTDAGPLVTDPARRLDLPPGFRYTVLERAGARMSDGYRVPGRPDGMDCFRGPDDTLILMRNHELDRDFRLAGYGSSPPEAYDAAAVGGVTRLVLRGKTLERISSNLVLTGTLRNCAGGASPWGWLSCEESTDKDHGFVFRCAIDAAHVRPAERILAYGRFRHEAACVDPKTLSAYLSEDQADGCLYRYKPRDLSRPHDSGQLQALRVVGTPRFETSHQLEHGAELRVEWVDIPDPNPRNDNVRYQAAAAGAARFSRGEGVFFSDDCVYLCCTSGGRANVGQVFKLTVGQAAPDRLELFAESPDAGVLDMPDNICVTPWGDVLVAEDGGGQQLVRGITPDGHVYDVARNALSSGEFAGICVSPNGDALFVNLQADGLTVAITGPLRELRRRAKHLARRAAVA